MFRLFTTLIAGLLAGLANAQPAFDCRRATAEIEVLICEDESLQALDRQLAKTWTRATAVWPPQTMSEQRAYQRGWIKGRNDCWKAVDAKACVTLSYQTRQVTLSISAGLVEDPGYRKLSCDGDNTTPFTATFYNSLRPRAAVLTRGNDQVIALSSPSASGARYVAQGVEFWSKGSEARVEWFGTTLNCVFDHAASQEPEAQ